ncbi:hypothetical protein GCM10025865_19410 [Paraoerskovia sediminicola]|uniref:Uncharacterized protein n=1 Tax=Paraoerskovia sediminicola TaxID=1138587 RepID=A0ABM8G3N5_9CELL|nr:hypothetical protein [Paraoerskovia sediminicola]BDZ42642.1 hypothetical protein GCM10025865_19410 [Paraoerskovia sediminicola]
MNPTTPRGTADRRGVQRARLGGSARALAGRPLVRVVGVALVLAAALGVIARTVGRGYVLVHDCVAVQGVPAWFGIHLALVRPSAHCPDGTLALGAAPGSAPVVVAVVALPVLLAQVGVAVALLGSAMLVRAVLRRTRLAGRRALRAVGRFVRVVALVPAGAGDRALPATTTACAPVLRRVSAGLVTVVTWRGPPRALLPA